MLVGAEAELRGDEAEEEADRERGALAEDAAVGADPDPGQPAAGQADDDAQRDARASRPMAIAPWGIAKPPTAIPTIP